LLAPFLIASLSSVLKAVGDLTLCQKINDAHWKRTEMHSVAGGILAGSIGTTISALVGGTGQSTFSSNIGLSMATGVTSRTVALPAGLIIIGLAFFPKLAAAFAVVPAPVMGAVLVYVTCFMILGGVQLMTSRMLDVRRTFVLGMSMVFGLSVDMVPGLYRNVPAVLQPIFSSELALATVLVVLLNLLFRIGVAKSHSTQITPDSERLHEIVTTYMEEHGAAWGMRKEVEERAAETIYELMLTLRGQGVTSPVNLRVKFDEFSLVADVDYAGATVQLPETPPTLEQLSGSEDGMKLLSGYIVRQHADKLSVSNLGNGQCRVHLHFEH
jgi:NCS2 family nucleobase:cation symporter-2